MNSCHRERARYRSFDSLRSLRMTIVLTLLVGCMEKDTTQRMAQAFQPRATHPDELPKMLNTDLPFRYPAALYARRAQGNVTLRLYVDTTGQVRADSTRIEESSGYAALDSAAVKGSQELRFVPAKLHGEPLATTVLFPVYFRHPEAHALPGDTILTKLSPTP
jgi:TonB family protein